MKYLACILLLFLSFSCIENISKQEKDNTANIKEASKKSIIPIVYNNQAFILNDSIYVYNTDFTLKECILDISGLKVNIDSISSQKYYIGAGDTFCEVYSLIKISSKKVNGWVYGKDVFEITTQKKVGNINKDSAFTIDGNDFKIYVLKNFGRGFEDEDGLTLCGEGNPVALYNSIYKRIEVIPVVDIQKTYSDNYLSMDNFDGWSDILDHISLHRDTLNLGIVREYQEGKAHFVVNIKLDPISSQAVVKRDLYYR